MLRRGAVLIFILLFVQPVLAQDQFGVMDYLSFNDGDKLYKYISGNWTFEGKDDKENKENEAKYLASIPSVIFDNIYDKSLADILVLVDKSGNVSEPKLIKGSKFKGNLYGARDVWVVILALDSDWTKTDKETSFVREVTEPIEDSSGLKLLQSAVKNDSVNAPDNNVEKDHLYLNKYVIPFKIKDTYQYSSSTKKIVAKISPLEYRLGSEEFVVASVVRSLGNLFAKGGISAEMHPKRPEDIEKKVDLKPIWKTGIGKNERKIYLGMAKFNLHENTLNRVKVNFPDLHAKGEKNAFTNFGNFSSSWWAISIGLGGTLNAEYGGKTHSESIIRADSDTIVVDTNVEVGDADQYFEPSGYIFGHLYFKRPMLPRPKLPHRKKDESATWRFLTRRSYSFVAGTKIEKDIFDNFFIGLGMGHIIGKVGIVAGISFRKVVETRSEKVNGVEQIDVEDREKTYRDERLLIALTFGL